MNNNEMEKEDYQRIDQVLKEVVRENRWEKGIRHVRVREIWKQEMGQAINKYTTEVNLRGEVLYVRLTHAVMRQELTYARQKIIDRINEVLGEEAIKKLILR